MFPPFFKVLNMRSKNISNKTLDLDLSPVSNAMYAYHNAYYAMRHHRDIYLTCDDTIASDERVRVRFKMHDHLRDLEVISNKAYANLTDAVDIAVLFILKGVTNGLRPWYGDEVFLDNRLTDLLMTYAILLSDDENCSWPATWAGDNTLDIIANVGLNSYITPILPLWMDDYNPVHFEASAGGMDILIGSYTRDYVYRTPLDEVLEYNGALDIHRSVIRSEGLQGKAVWEYLIASDGYLRPEDVGGWHARMLLLPALARVIGHDIPFGNVVFTKEGVDQTSEVLAHTDYGSVYGHFHSEMF